MAVEPDTDRQARAEIEVTPEMVEAGIQELREYHIGQPWEEIVEAVFVAMRLEQLDMRGQLGGLCNGISEVLHGKSTDGDS